jgi:hypothetical protein
MLLKLICCNVFQREACLAIAYSPHTIDPEFLELGEHARPDRLRQTIQARIDAAEQQAKTLRCCPVVVRVVRQCRHRALRSHHATWSFPVPTIAVRFCSGPRERFRQHFEHNLSAPFSSVGYLERGNYFLRTDLGDGQIHYGDQYAALVEQYGEDNAKYIWESMHPEGLEPASTDAVFIDIPETACLGSGSKFRAKVEAEGKQYRCLEGDLRLIRGLIDGRWNSEEFLIVEPGQQTAGVYDWEEVICARRSRSDDSIGPPASDSQII